MAEALSATSGHLGSPIGHQADGPRNMGEPARWWQGHPARPANWAIRPQFDHTPSKFHPFP